MKTARIAILFIVAFLIGGPLYPRPAAAVDSKTDRFVNKVAQPVDFTQSADVGDYRSIAAQAIYADGTPAGHTVSDGRKSTAKITVASLSDLSTAYAKVTITVADNPTTTGVVITLNSQRFTEGIDWFKGVVSSMTAYSIASAVNRAQIFDSTHTGTGAVAVASVTVVGTGPNSWGASASSAAITFSATTFLGGKNAASVTINGVTLTNGVDWQVGATSVTTAAEISRAINASASLTGVVVSSVTGTGAPGSGIVFATAALVGLNAYDIHASTIALTPSVPYFSGGLASDIDISNDLITHASHGFTTALKVLVSTPSVNSIPTGLVWGTTYFAIPVTDNTYKLASTANNAVAGTAVDITALPGTSTMTVTPLALSGAPSFKWQASNDNSSWSDLVVSSVTYSASGNTLWDFGDFNYRYLRFNFVGPTNGGLAIQAIIQGKK